jgi:hypothetical protein
MQDHEETCKEGVKGLRKLHESKHVEAMESALRLQLYLKRPGNQFDRSAHTGHDLM